MATEKQKTCKHCLKPKEGDNPCNCGRPTKYDRKYIKEVSKYLKANQDEEVQLVKLSNPEKGYEAYENKLIVKLPTIEGFARFIKINKDTLYGWEEKHPLFSDALDKIRQEQQQRLLNKGLSGEYNSTIAKLILSSNHGMRERTETDLTSKGEKIGGFNFIKPDGSKDLPDNKATT